MTEREIIKEAIKETTEIIYDCLKRVDEINKRLIIAIMVIVIVFGIVLCYDKYKDCENTYIPENCITTTDDFEFKSK